MYTDIINELENNADQKVSDVLPRIIELASAKKATGSQGSTYIKSNTGETVAILCYYFKRWMPLTGPEAVEFGTKKSTATGFNTMCKSGVSNWSKQNKLAKDQLASILDRVEAGEIDIQAIQAEKEAIRADKEAIVETDLGFETKEELVTYLQNNDIDFAE